MSYSRHRGFTLLELLVVIAVIAIAAALLLPVLSHNGDRSRRTTCASNLNQIGKACFMYADVPANGTFPKIDTTGSAASNIASLGMLYPNYIADFRVFSCPTSPTVQGLSTSLKPYDIGTGGNTTLILAICGYMYDSRHGNAEPLAGIAGDKLSGSGLSTNHGTTGGVGNGGNLLTGGGSVEFLTTITRPVGLKPDGTAAVDNIGQDDSTANGAVGLDHDTWLR